MDKVGSNFVFAHQFRLDYKRQFGIDIYNVECVVYTVNNVVYDVLHWLLPTKRDDQLISNYINQQFFDLNDKTPQLNDCKLFRYIFIFLNNLK